MQDLIIIGAGGFGREVLCWALDVERTQSVWRIKGFLDDNPAALDGFGTSHSIIGAPATYLPTDNELFCCAIGSPKIRMRVVRAMLAVNAKFTSLIHPTAIIGQNSVIGEGCIVCPRTIITANVTVGDYVVFNDTVSVGHDAVIGDGSTINGHCELTGFTVLGKEVFLGTHAVILPGKRVGDNATVGAGSIVMQNVMAGTTVFGAPAKLIRFPSVSAAV